jgi:hypothetical protein
MLTGPVVLALDEPRVLLANESSANGCDRGTVCDRAEAPGLIEREQERHDGSLPGLAGEQ